LRLHPQRLCLKSGLVCWDLISMADKVSRQYPGLRVLNRSVEVADTAPAAPYFRPTRRGRDDMRYNQMLRSSPDEPDHPAKDWVFCSSRDMWAPLAWTSPPSFCYFQRGCVAQTLRTGLRSPRNEAHVLKRNFPRIRGRISVNSILSIAIGECDVPQPCGSP
jgi:hypothetical protein